MKRLLAAAFVLVLFPASLSANPLDELRVAPNRAVREGEHIVVFSLYATETGDTLLATESHRVAVDARGQYSATFDNVAAFGQAREAWLAMRILPGVEGPRKRVTAASRAIRVHALATAAITAPGFVESTVDGFRFPSGATFTGFGTPPAVGTSNSEGIASTISRSDHVHAHGNQAGGSLHSDATTSVSGFLSGSDKTRLDSLPAYKRTIIVSPTPGDAALSGFTLVTALNAITGNSASDPYLLRIEPGIYNIGNDTLTMKPYVDVEGSGQNATFLQAARSNASLISSSAAVAGADHAELRNLTITNTGSALAETTGYFMGNGIATIRDVTITASGGTSNNQGICYNGSVSGNSLTISNVTATATGGSTTANGLRVSGTNGNIVLRDSTVTASGSSGTNRGTVVASGSTKVFIDGSTLLADGSSGATTGLNVTNTKVTVYNSAIRSEGTGVGTHTGVLLANTASAIVHIEHSYIKAPGTNFALNKTGALSFLRVATSMVETYGADSPANPTCIFTYSPTFTTNSCGPPPL